jgi:hypothetical protein
LRRYFIAGALSLVVAAVIASFANGAFAARESEHVAGQLGPEFSGRDVLEYRRQMEGDAYGCTGGGSLVFFATWLGGTYYFGRKRKPKGDPDRPSL